MSETSQKAAESPEDAFRKRLKMRRREHNLTQVVTAARASKLGVVIHQQTINAIERRGRGVSLNEAVALSYAVGASPIEMIFPDEASRSEVVALRAELAATEAKLNRVVEILRNVADGLTDPNPGAEARRLLQGRRLPGAESKRFPASTRRHRG